MPANRRADSLTVTRATETEACDIWSSLAQFVKHGRASLGRRGYPEERRLACPLMHGGHTPHSGRFNIQLCSRHEPLTLGNRAAPCFWRWRLLFGWPRDRRRRRRIDPAHMPDRFLDGWISREKLTGVANRNGWTLARPDGSFGDSEDNGPRQRLSCCLHRWICGWPRRIYPAAAKSAG